MVVVPVLPVVPVAMAVVPVAMAVVPVAMAVVPVTMGLVPVAMDVVAVTMGVVPVAMVVPLTIGFPVVMVPDGAVVTPVVIPCALQVRWCRIILFKENKNVHCNRASEFAVFGNN